MFHISNRTSHVGQRGARVGQPVAVMRAAGMLGQQIGAQRRLPQQLRPDPEQQRRRPTEQQRRADRAAHHHQAHRPHAADDRRRRRRGDIGIPAQIAAPAVEHHQQAQPPERPAQNAGDVAAHRSRRRREQFRVQPGNLRMAVMGQMKRGVELRVQQRRRRGQPAHDRVGAARGERGLMHRLMRRREQRDLHQAEHEHRRHNHPAGGDGDPPPGRDQAGQMHCEAQPRRAHPTALCRSATRRGSGPGPRGLSCRSLLRAGVSRESRPLQGNSRDSPAPSRPMSDRDQSA